jgi:threonine dehydratase
VTAPALHDVHLARRRVASVVRPTALVASAWLADAVGADVRLALETQQVTHSFKIRGAVNAISALRERAGSDVRLVTASAGNHGVALACAAASAGVPATVFTPANAPLTKLRAIARYGADLRAEAYDYDDAEARALAYAGAYAATYVSPYNHPDIIAGAGTLGLELIDVWPDLDVVLVPVGGGGLISGIAIAIKATRPAVRIVGVEAENNPVFTRSLEAGRITHVDVRPTIADGLSGNLEAGSLTFDIVRELVDDMVTVGEVDLRRAIRGLVAHDHVVAEGGGVPAVAALLAGKAGIGGKKVAAIVSGSNIDLDTLIEALTA